MSKGKQWRTCVKDRANWFSKNYKARTWILSLITTLWTLAGTLEGTCIKHAPPICFLFQQILKKLMKHLVLYMCWQFRKNTF